MASTSTVLGSLTLLLSLAASHVLFLTWHPRAYVKPLGARTDPCADYPDVDEYKAPTDDTCYIRAYRCDPDTRNKIENRDAGDASWAASNLGLSCGHYGTYLKVWRIEVSREVLAN